MPSPEQIEKAIAKVKPSHATFFVMEKDLSSKQLRNVRVFFPELYTYTKVVALLDTTLMKSGKEGFLLTQGSLHIHKLRDQVVSLLSIQKATASGSDVTITYSNGTTAQFYASIYAEDICAFLNALGPVERHKEEPRAAVPQKEAPRSAPQPEPAAAPQPKPVVKAEPKPEPKPQPKPEPNSQPKTADQLAPKPQPQPKQQPKPSVPGQTEFEKGLEAMKQGREQEAIPLFEIAADKNIISAMYNLSLLYGWKKDYASAFDWMLKAARKGYKQAYTPLSRMYLAGIGTQRDLFAAQYWARMAVQNGDSAAQPLLAQTDGNWRDFLRNMEVGKRFEFGTYPQTEDGQLKPIIWRVLDKQADKMLVLSEYVLDAQEFDEVPKGAPDNWRPVWAKCKLRTWLHNNFMKTAFFETDTSRIMTTNVHTPSNPDYGLIQESIGQEAIEVKRDTTMSPDSADKLFLLSWDEVIRYFNGACDPTLQSLGFREGKREISFMDKYWFNFPNHYAASIATPYVCKLDEDDTGKLVHIPNTHKAYTSSLTFCDWWLRSSCLDYGSTRFRNGDIFLNETTLYISSGFHTGASLCSNDSYIQFEMPKPGSVATASLSDKLGVRPAMWIDLR